jgi:hypothetical protein
MGLGEAGRNKEASLSTVPLMDTSPRNTVATTTPTE